MNNKDHRYTIWRFENIDHGEIAGARSENAISVLVIGLKRGSRFPVGIAPSVSATELKTLREGMSAMMETNALL